MCGIAGFLDPQRRLRDRDTLLKNMVSSLRHRGPDGHGVWQDNVAGISLGHSRLSVIDLSETGRQPMISANRRWVISYNGEIYNYPELRRTLISDGKTLRGRSDTEALLEAIASFGLQQTLSKVNGMFAFALWDCERHELWLVRDRLGKKPLYFGIVDGALIFGSEIRVFERVTGFQGAASTDAVTRYLQLGYVPAPLSIYQDVWKLRPGHALCIRDIGSSIDPSSSAPYWSVAKVAEDGRHRMMHLSDADAIDALDDVLGTAVRTRLVSDVPIGAFLSGGIDSSLIVALMQKESSETVRTFSIGVQDKGYDEAPFARAVADHLGTNHTEFYVAEQDALDIVPDLPSIFDEPLGDSSLIPTFIVSRLARQQVTVALSGDGGDELFAGYNRHFWLNRIWGKGPGNYRAPWRTLGRILSLLSAERWNQLLRSGMAVLPHRMQIRAPGNKIQKLIPTLQSVDLQTAYESAVTHWPHAAALTKGRRAAIPTVFEDPAFKNFEADPLAATTCMDMLSYLPDDILAKVDRATMAVGLEARAPFLDRDVVELAWRLGNEMKIRDGIGKWLPRQLLARYVPRKLTDRAKAGFGMPIDAWLRGPLRDWAEDLLSERSLREGDLLEPFEIRRAWSQLLARKTNLHQPLWDILMLQMWLRSRAVNASNSNLRI